MKKSYILLAGFLLLLKSCSAQKTELKLNLENGKEYTQTMIAKSNIVQNLNGQSVNMDMTILGKTSYSVKSVSDSYYDMDVKFVNLSMEMQLPQGSMKFSSEYANEQDIFSTLLAELKNKPFEVRMTKTGKVERVLNIEKIFDSLFEKFPQITEEQRIQIKNQLMNAYGEKAFKGNLEMISSIFPDKPVSIGDKWNVETQLESGMAGKMKSQYEFKSLKNGLVIILGNSTLETADKDAYIESNGMPLKYDLKGTMNSEVSFDQKSGWISSAKINQDIKGKAYVKANPQIPNGMEIPMSMKTNMTITDK